MVIIVEIDKDIEEIVPGFLENRTKELDILKEAIKTNNFEELKSIGHKISGNAGSYGFDELGEIGAKLEENASNGKMEAIKQNVADIELYLTDIEVKYV